MFSSHTSYPTWYRHPTEVKKKQVDEPLTWVTDYFVRACIAVMPLTRMCRLTAWRKCTCNVRIFLFCQSVKRFPPLDAYSMHLPSWFMTRERWQPCELRSFTTNYFFCPFLRWLRNKQLLFNNNHLIIVRRKEKGVSPQRQNWYGCWRRPAVYQCLLIAWSS